jgi:hypothetical protein
MASLIIAALLDYDWALKSVGPIAGEFEVIARILRQRPLPYMLVKPPREDEDIPFNRWEMSRFGGFGAREMRHRKNAEAQGSKHLGGPEALSSEALAMWFTLVAIDFELHNVFKDAGRESWWPSGDFARRSGSDSEFVTILDGRSHASSRSAGLAAIGRCGFAEEDSRRIEAWMEGKASFVGLRSEDMS